MRTPPIYRPTTMARFSSLVAIAAVATVTLDALVPGADAARLGTWMMSSEFALRAAPAPPPCRLDTLRCPSLSGWASWGAGSGPDGVLVVVNAMTVVLWHYSREGSLVC